MRRLTCRRAFTLIELLVVVTIMLILLVIALPLLTPTLESRRIRESARAVHVYLGRARSLAMQTGRPCGVMFQRSPTMNQATTTLFLVEVPPPYAGDTEDTKIQLARPDRTTDPGLFKIVAIPTGSVTISDTSQTVRVGDQLQLNHQGPLFDVDGPDGNGDGYVDNTGVELRLDLTKYRLPAWTAAADRDGAGPAGLPSAKEGAS